MRGWLFFHNPVEDNVPEAREIKRFLQVGHARGIKLDVLQPRAFELIVATESDWRAQYDGQKLARPDFIIPRTGSETSYFTLAVLRHFKRKAVDMINGPDAVEACADKLHTLQLLSANGLPIPRTILAKFPVDVDVIERELGFPVVVKTLRSTRGAGVLLCNDRQQFNDLASLLGDSNPSADFIFQQYVKSSHGRDVRLLVIDGKVTAAMERRATDGGFKSNISLGGVGVQIEPPADMAKLALDAAAALQLDVAGIDVLFDAAGYRICEANSSPGFSGLEDACEVSVPDAVFDLVERRGQASAPPRRNLWSRLLRPTKAAAKADRTVEPRRQKAPQPERWW